MNKLLSNPAIKAELILNKGALKNYLKERGWTLLDLSQNMGISYDMLHRVLRGNRNPGGQFVAGLLLACKGGTFDQFFIVTDDKRQREEQAV
jgi:transcriptional regulator with XRE-family HTH domain